MGCVHAWSGRWWRPERAGWPADSIARVPGDAVACDAPGPGRAAPWAKYELPYVADDTSPSVPRKTRPGKSGRLSDLAHDVFPFGIPESRHAACMGRHPTAPAIAGSIELSQRCVAEVIVGERSSEGIASADCVHDLRRIARVAIDLVAGD